MEWIAEALGKVRERRPLVHNITNYVVMNSTANALLALGASPVMAHAEEELEEMVALADALVINIGTLDGERLRAMLKAVKIAGKLGKPVVLDPVGAGSTKFRTEASLKLLNTGDISIVRGNFGEISALVGRSGLTRGVDTASYSPEDALQVSEKAAEKFGTVVALTGPVDYVSNSGKTYAVSNGTPLFGRITGAGCISTAIIGAFLAVEEPLKAGVVGLAVLGVVGELAAEESPLPGSFHMKLYDWLYRIDGSLLMERAKVEPVKSEEVVP
ncbi:hydroxyethylthiazole kinase [Thermococcus sp. M36]|uniref:hydroxyethylthiazole kinase n=1 Tax=Thermococcus sp. M36 TaxID=1638261 RepID=UPI00143A2D63|nr:hydroxyethylthiazole kinase [Thermococcus sp. M36]NJE06565.1 hydroxyethylthiazole kinase [Thermococcus sp. M36]